MTWCPESRRAGRLPREVLPWLVYAGVTVVAPAAHGAWRDPAFAEHAAITLLVSSAVFGVWAACACGRAPRETHETAGVAAAPRAPVNLVDLRRAPR